MWNTEQLWAGEYTPLVPVSLVQHPFPACWHHLLPFPARVGPAMQVINADDAGELFQRLRLS